MGVEQKAVGEAINLGSGKDHTVLEMAKLVNQVSSNESGMKFVERRDWDVKTKLLSSIEKAKRLLGYSPKVSFESGIDQVHEWFSTNWDDIVKSAEF